MLHLQPSIGGRKSVLVSLLRLYSLCIGHFGPQVCVQIIELTSPFLQDYRSRDRGSGSGSGVCLDYVPGVLAIEGQKGGNAGCGRNRFVIRKFCYGQNLHPIVLLVVNITMQVTREASATTEVTSRASDTWEAWDVTSNRTPLLVTYVPGTH